MTGAISKVGDALVRTALYEAAHVMLTRAVRFSMPLGVSRDEIEREQLFRVMDERELRSFAAAGVDIQLHSPHNWRLYDKEKVESEIEENRRLLRRVISRPLQHFWYPSGVYGLHQAEWLAESGVKTATTINPGLNYADISPFAPRRLVGGGPVSEIEFAAEMSGFTEVVRLLRRRLRVRRSQRAGASMQPSGPGQPCLSCDEGGR